MPALYRALTPVEVEEIIASSETQMELMKRYQVAQSTISNIKASRAALAQVYNEINLTDVLDEVSALVKRFIRVVSNFSCHLAQTCLLSGAH